MPRQQASAASSSFFLLNLASAGVAPSSVSLGADAAVAAGGNAYTIGGCLDPGTTISSPNVVPLIDSWAPPSSPMQVDGWPILSLHKVAGTGTGTVYAGAERSSLAAPSSTDLPARVDTFLDSPIALPETVTRLMLDAAATEDDAVNIYTTESSTASSAAGCVLVGTLYGGGRYLDVRSTYLQVEPLAFPYATKIFVAGIQEGASSSSALSGAPPTITTPTTGSFVVALRASGTSSGNTVWIFENLGTGGAILELGANDLATMAQILLTTAGALQFCPMGGSVVTVTTAGVAIGVGVGNPDASCILDLVSNSAGLGIPVLTTSQKDNLTPPAGKHPILFDSNLGKLCVWSGSAWQTVTST